MLARELSKSSKIHAVKFIILNDFRDKMFDIRDIVSIISDKYDGLPQQVVDEAIDDMLSKGELSVIYSEEQGGWFYKSID